MKIELKHFQRYPIGERGILVDHPDSGGRFWIVGLYVDVVICENDINAGCYEYPFDEIYPILRPLDLTKEIEADGEKFVPVEKLKELQRKLHDITDREEDIENGDKLDARIDYLPQEIELLGPAIVHLGPHWIAMKLYQWHFDLNDLIKNNLATRYDR